MKKIALCIGVADYEYATKLKNPTHDSEDISEKFKELGYIVTIINNPNRIELLRAMEKHNEESLISDASIVYYAGHGIQSKGINYIVPVDANPLTESELDIFCISINKFVSEDKNEGYRTNIFIFDACRDNPFSRSWNRSHLSQGFSPILAPSGTLIAFSTSPGKSASDGNLRNGLYTQCLLPEITKPDLSIIQVFQNVRQKLIYLSNNSQLSWESTSLVGDFYFNPISFNPSDPRIRFIRNEVARIEESIFSFDKREVEAMNESAEGGVIFVYTGEVDKKIEKQLFAEGGRLFEDVYLDNGLPIYYRVATHNYNVPIYIDKKAALELNSEEFDDAKTRIDIAEYFLHGNEIIGFNEIKSKNPKEKNKLQNASIKEEINRIIIQSNNSN